ncbi:MAG: hypothetical protein V7L05_19070 [Nostoc sp.]|uniref:hypothetical protein n=1 Tax=Nostoc sp. TaxID=1180 RepID=UPI002FFB4CFC
MDSSLNLAYYLALRRHDLRLLQTALMPWGISSLGRIEARVLPNLDAVIATLAAICQAPDGGLWNGRKVADCKLTQCFHVKQMPTRKSIL